MKTGADLQQARHASFNSNPAKCRFGNSAKNFHEGAFPRPIPSDNPNHLTTFDFEGDILQCPKILPARPGRQMGNRTRSTSDSRSISVLWRSCFSQFLIQ